MIELKEEWGYDSRVLKESESIDEILSVVVPLSRQYLDSEGMDNPQYIITYAGESITVDCDMGAKKLKDIKRWYEGVERRIVNRLIQGDLNINKQYKQALLKDVDQVKEA